jgi:hypothetical protein
MVVAGVRSTPVEADGQYVIGGSRSDQSRSLRRFTGIGHPLVRNRKVGEIGGGGAAVSWRLLQSRWGAIGGRKRVPLGVGRQPPPYRPHLARAAAVLLTLEAVLPHAGPEAARQPLGSPVPPAKATTPTYAAGRGT